MDLALKGRVALVTGGSKGIGKSIALALSAEGAKVIICAREVAPLSVVEKQIRREGGEALAVLADATDPVAVQDVIARAVAGFGGLDILINNIGGTQRFGGFLELTDEDWRDTFKLNVMTMVYFVRYALPALRRSSSPRIINISSISGFQPGSYNPHYTITKAAVINLSKSLANQLAQEGILVNVVCPGPVHSYSWERNVQRVAEVRGLPLTEAKTLIDIEEARKIPLGSIGEGEDVAGFVTFLASRKAGWITGACFHVNGGKLESV